ncbi:radical SAM domain-containing protein [Desulfatibacillum aliphaticivorans]|uniref:Radical SAM domain-containing protein n=1 Tax=Desulfatibacillum aliphaticivorans TaxID=218208 RepID=B8FB70_DESAL|nr:radical SAM domain-containing protein [Desulfatibacillum aliphaticivorans]ACL04514.1 radical SAM domain-containing protein [Desulfatibacillum aliphaticivorans]
MNINNALNPCRVCPRNCGVDRTGGENGFCGLDHQLHISWAGLHQGEEPMFSGPGGTANFFFTSCNLACVYCQNYQISQQGLADSVCTPEDFAQKALELEAAGAGFLGLVSPSHQVPQVREALVHAQKAGVGLPVLYNSSAYDSVEMLKSLDGLVDVYLPDLKYSSNAMAEKYSQAPGYVEAAREAVLEMHRQTGDMDIDPDSGLANKGVWVRLLVLPGDVSGLWESLCFLALEVSTGIGLSIMSQYSPLHRAGEFPEINRTITQEEYDQAVGMAEELGFELILTQDPEKSPENAVPDFTDEKKPFASF